MDEKEQYLALLSEIIAKGIVEAHQGLIGAESEEGKGSLFYLTLPLNANL